VSNIKEAFKNGKAFIGFITGGDPSVEKSEEFIYEMINGGADLIEIGVPFSDPIAEGPVIQRANIRALKAGANIDALFDLVARARKKTAVPIVFLTYLNPVFRYGYDAFFAKCREKGVDGVIIPDMPFEEQGEIRGVSDENGCDLISLVAPTSKGRVSKIAKNSTGFLYVVSSMGVTGIRGEITTDLSAMISAAKAATDTPVAVGFGINTPEQAAEIASGADGVIVGSALVKIVEERGGEAGVYIREYVKSMKDAITANLVS
jgi:tryptophan synthase alpha chain